MRNDRWFLPATILLALTVALAVFMRVEAARHEATGAASSCRINETLDCDKVQGSAWGKVFGVSLSTWGAAGNLVVLLWLLAARRRRGLLPLVGLFALANAVVGVAMFLVSWLGLGAFCLYCSGLQVLMLAIAALVVPPGLRAFRAARTEGAGTRRDHLGLAGIAAALVVSLFVAGDAYAGNRANFAHLLIPYEGKATRIDLAGRLVMGDPATPNTVVVFFCFGCPNCRACYHSARAALKHRQVRAKVHFVFKHFPLDEKCNKKLEGGANKGSCRASHAAQAAAERGKAEEAMAYLFGLKDKNQQFTNYNIDAMPRKLRLRYESKGKWRAAREQPRVREVIRRDIAEGTEMGLIGVPAVYLNGRSIRSKDLLTDVKRLAGAR